MTQEIIEVVLHHVRQNSLGQYITTIPEMGTLKLEDRELGWDGFIYREDGSVTELEHLSEDERYKIYCYLYDNRYNLVFQENLIEIRSVEDIHWAVEPQYFSVPCETAEGGMMKLGAIAVGREPLDAGKELRSVIFISPDNTYATLTCYLADSEEEKATAKKDLEKIAEEIKNFISRL